MTTLRTAIALAICPDISHALEAVDCVAAEEVERMASALRMTTDELEAFYRERQNGEAK